MLRTKGCCKAHGFINGEISVPGAENFSFEQMKLNEDKDSLSEYGTDIPERKESVSKRFCERLRAFCSRIFKLFTHN